MDMRRALSAAATLIGSGLIAGASYRTAMMAPLPTAWSLAQFEWAGVVSGTVFGVVAGVVSRQPLAVIGGASVGLLFAAAELETHTDVIVGPWLAINLALENQISLTFPVLVALGTGAVAGDWIHGRVSTKKTKSS